MEYVSSIVKGKWYEVLEGPEGGQLEERDLTVLGMNALARMADRIVPFED